MRINLAHLRERAQSGGFIDFAVFDARSTNESQSSNAALLARLTAAANNSGLKVDQAALAFSQNGRVHFCGSKPLVAHLSQAGVPHWTHTIEL